MPASLSALLRSALLIACVLEQGVSTSRGEYSRQPCQRVCPLPLQLSQQLWIFVGLQFVFEVIS